MGRQATTSSPLSPIARLPDAVSLTTTSAAAAACSLRSTSPNAPRSVWAIGRRDMAWRGRMSAIALARIAGAFPDHLLLWRRLPAGWRSARDMCSDLILEPLRHTKRGTAGEGP